MTKYTNFTCKYIDLDPILIEHIQETVLDNIPNKVEFYQALKNVEIPDILGQQVEEVALVKIPPSISPELAHTDILCPYGEFLALNIPLANCENSQTVFWTTNEPRTRDRLKSKHGYGWVYTKDCVAIDEFYLTRPVLFNHQVLHNVYNWSDKPRYAISIRFFKDPWHWI
jgi:hypothetical protein